MWCIDSMEFLNEMKAKLKSRSFLKSVNFSKSFLPYFVKNQIKIGDGCHGELLTYDALVPQCTMQFLFSKMASFQLQLASPNSPLPPSNLRPPLPGLFVKYFLSFSQKKTCHQRLFTFQFLNNKIYSYIKKAIWQNWCFGQFYHSKIEK